MNYFEVFKTHSERLNILLFSQGDNDDSEGIDQDTGRPDGSENLLDSTMPKISGCYLNSIVILICLSESKGVRNIISFTSESFSLPRYYQAVKYDEKVYESSIEVTLV